MESLNFDWEVVSEEEKRELGDKLKNATPGLVGEKTKNGANSFRRFEDESFFKVDWERVPELVESRRVLLKKGKAYVPIREQLSMILAEFTSRLEKGLQVGIALIPLRTHAEKPHSSQAARCLDWTKTIASHPFLTICQRTLQHLTLRSTMPMLLFLGRRSTLQTLTNCHSTSLSACAVSILNFEPTS